MDIQIAEGVMKEVAEEEVEGSDTGWTTTVTFNSNPMSTNFVFPLSPIDHLNCPAVLGSSSSTSASHSDGPTALIAFVSTTSSFAKMTSDVEGVEGRPDFLPPPPVPVVDDDEEHAEGEREGPIEGDRSRRVEGSELLDDRGEKNDVRREGGFGREMGTWDRRGAVVETLRVESATPKE